MRLSRHARLMIDINVGTLRNCNSETCMMRQALGSYSISIAVQRDVSSYETSRMEVNLYTLMEVATGLSRCARLMMERIIGFFAL